MTYELIPVRLSHIIGQSGVGAIVHGTRNTVVVHDIRQWAKRDGGPGGEIIPYVERVRSALGIDQQLRYPPVAQEVKNGQIDGTCIPATRFPSWMRCAKCGAISRASMLRISSNDNKRPDLRCTNCDNESELEQVVWALAHPQGYLAEVPWQYLTHKDPKNDQQRHCKLQDHMLLISNKSGRFLLHCRGCGARSQYRGNEILPLVSGKQQPWTKDAQIPNDEGAPSGQILTINDTRTYAPRTASALVIPPESRVRKGTVVDLIYRTSEDRKKIDNARTSFRRKQAIKNLASNYRCQPQDIELALTDLENGYPLYGENLTSGQLLESEYDAFLEPLPDQQDDEDLVTHDQSDAWHGLTEHDDLPPGIRHIVGCVEHIIRADRIKAVQIFKGFTRLYGDAGADETTIVPPDIIGQPDWLPAIELYGEGIFINLSEERIRKWEQNNAVGKRLAQIQPRFAQSGREEPGELSARFMLLHTLSHLLMRQIESEGGYPAASLNERIYCAEAPKPMAGILIHVAVPDVAGSLGGLAELAEPKRFLGILTRALEHAQWCSLDPVCSEHEGQGPGLLNRAACHACALVPEPACDYGNTLLDRVFVKGDRETGLPSLFAV